ncbi:primosomal replication protein PriB/PriC domain protein [Pseudomonas aeruginosa]|uniref:primosomal replication protein PriB/PriC domain protein n=1 Tax=Pseudomonas aeruginosa TaxID=287 RepID=UPI000F7DD24C|nr:primosomal replication protein PriB/PriC domain protein [Pseudomonas aeruginosa]MBA5056575.1 primosomal replication protein PriB/PriC domain protein [Pseudomonas aeruginosa]MCL0277556.1 primosomal replication protein PriB/PriC domain protein [Pseudomonas aeruginosa]MDI9282724.1 primosomal replication protein PriB/PriC domain protein [Pseudomonas aeruginosa]RTB60039.1 primosomal replication protein PriB/PriC domain protein [Pseudomonas aeruginosa]RUD97632.1 primosomal replication protein Pri
MALTAQQMLDKYLEAEAAVLEGRTVIFNGRTHTMEDIEKIRAGRQEWERRAAADRDRAAGRRPGPALAEFC